MTTDTDHTVSVWASEINGWNEQWNNYPTVVNPVTLPSFDPHTGLRLCRPVLDTEPRVLHRTACISGNE